MLYVLLILSILWIVLQFLCYWYGDYPIYVRVKWVYRLIKGYCPKCGDPGGPDCKFCKEYCNESIF